LPIGSPVISRKAWKAQPLVVTSWLPLVAISISPGTALMRCTRVNIPDLARLARQSWQRPKRLHLGLMQQQSVILDHRTLIFLATRAN
jgi:hypothetical protein